MIQPDNLRELADDLDADYGSHLGEKPQRVCTEALTCRDAADTIEALQGALEAREDQIQHLLIRIADERRQNRKAMRRLSWIGTFIALALGMMLRMAEIVIWE